MSEKELYSIFNAIPIPCLVLRPNFPTFTMVAANDARLRATMTRREDFLGRGLFEVFPDNPDDPQASGVANLTASLMRVMEEKQAHQMALQKYDIPLSNGSGFEVRYWQPTNLPVFNEKNELTFLLHMVEDVTKSVLLREEHRKSKLEYETLFSTHPDMVFSLDLNGFITRVNKEMVRVSGFEEKELLSMPFSALLLPTEVDQVRSYLRQCTEGRPFTFQTTFLSATKRRHELALSIMPLFVNEEVYGVYGIARDVTAELRYEREKHFLAQVREIFSREPELVECLKELVMVFRTFTNSRIIEAWTVNVDHTEVELRAEAISNSEAISTEREVFHRGEGLVGLAWEKGETIHLSDLPQNSQYFRRQYALRNKLRFGTAVPVFYREQVIAVFVFYNENHPQFPGWFSESLIAHLANEIHRKREEYELNQFFNLSPDMLAMVGFDGYFKKFNSVFSDVLGYAESELLAKQLLEFVFPADQKIAAVAIEEAADRVPMSFEARFLAKNGTLKWLSWRSNPSTHERMLFVVARDITERRRLEEAYESERQRFTRLFQEAPVSMSILKGKKHIFQDVNPAFYQLARRENLVGRGFVEAFPEMTSQNVPFWLNEVYRTGETLTVFEAPVQLMADDKGQERHCYFTFMFQPYRNRGGEIEGVFLFGMDVTEQVEARRIAEESQKQYLHLMESLPVAVYATDSNGRLTMYNRAFGMLVGHEPMPGEDVTQPAWRLSIERPDVDSTSNELENGSSGPVEIVVKPHQGDLRNVIWHRSPVTNTRDEAEGSINVLNDITERKRVENELHKLSLIAQNTDNAVIITNVEGKIEWVNQAFTRMTGYTLEEVVGKTKPEVVDGDHTDKSMRENLAHQPQQEHLHYEIVNYNKAGQPFWVEVRHQPLYDSNGKITNFFDIATDITLRKEAHEKLVASENQIRRFAGQLNTVLEEERARIAREIHDEFGQQLAGLKLMIQSLNNFAVDETNGILHRMIETVDQTIKSLRRFATELRPGILDTLGLVPSIEWLVKDIEEKTGIRCTLSLTNTSPPLDKTISICCFRICQEALTNIMKHSGATRIRVQLAVSPDRLHLVVADNGKGMNLQTNQSPFSMGILGMEERAHLVGGHLSVSSVVGTGMTVELSIELE